MSRWCLLAGALLGAAHVVDAGWPLAWAGFALLAYALDADGPGQPEAPARAWRAIGVLVAAILTESIANAWLVSTAGSWLGLSLHLSLRLAAVACCLMGAMLAAPSILAALVLPSRWGSAWLPVTWALGEALRGRVSGVTTSDWLMVHWQSERALHALYWLGWYPALLVGLGCATCVGVLARRSRLLAAVALVVVCAVAPLPAVRTDPALVRGVALVRRSRLLAAVALVVVCAVTDPAPCAASRSSRSPDRTRPRRAYRRASTCWCGRRVPSTTIRPWSRAPSRASASLYRCDVKASGTSSDW
jgi:hypothetical protein